MGIRKRLSYANVMATLAVFVALGGGAYAVSLGKNDVKSRHIKKGGVKSSDIRDRNVKATDVGEDAISSEQVADGSLRGVDVDETSLGRVPDAGGLRGLGPAVFYRAANVRFGQGTSTAATAEPIVSLPQFPARVTTDGDPDSPFDLVLRNDRPPGGGGIAVLCPDTAGTVGAGGNGEIFVETPAATCTIADGSGGRPAYFLQCSGATPEILCLAIRGA